MNISAILSVATMKISCWFSFSVLFSLSFPYVVKGELHAPFEELVQDVDWVVIGELVLDERVDIEIRITDRHFDPIRHSVVVLLVGDLNTEGVLYSRNPIEGIPATYPVMIRGADRKRYPLNEIAAWTLRYNSLHYRYHADWLNPEVYQEVKEVLDFLETEKQKEERNTTDEKPSSDVDD